MRILITNDDGIDSPGLAVLERVAAQMAEDVWVVAPETDQSGLSHSLTLGDPLRIRALGSQRFALRGTPSDCVIMATRRIMASKPDLILSGINIGQNAADDVTYSGTVAGAIEGTLIGVPSIAFSLAFDHEGDGDPQWETAEHFAPEVIKKLLDFGFPDGVLFNVNFPDIPKSRITGIDGTKQGRLIHSLFIDERTDPRGMKYYWLSYRRQVNERIPGTDLHAINSGAVSITPMRLDLTDHVLADRLQQHLAEGQ